MIKKTKSIFKGLLPFVFCIGFVFTSMAQRARVITLPKRVKTVAPVTMKENLLDRSDYKRSPIAYKAIVPNPNKGYKADSLYTWTDPTGAKKSLLGKDIVAQVNEFEKELNKRGRSLRDKDAFSGLSLPLNKVKKNDFSKVQIKNEITTKYSPINISSKNATAANISTTGNKSLTKPNIILSDAEGQIFAYLGYVLTGDEFRDGQLSNEYMPTITGSDIKFDLMLAIPKSLQGKVKSCHLEVKKTAAGKTLLSTNLNVQKPDRIIPQSKYELKFNNTVETYGAAKLADLNLYRISLNNSSKSIPKPTKTKDVYSIVLTFLDNTGKELKIIQPNSLTLNNQMPPPINVSTELRNAQNGYNFELLDPGLHAFGFYAKSGGILANVKKEPFGYNGLNVETSVSTDFKIGAKYYNFERLLNSKAPLSIEYNLFAYNLKSSRKYTYPDTENSVPKSKGFVYGDPDFGTVSLLGETYDLSKTEATVFEQSIEEELFNMRFAIGPVPCRFTASFKGKVGIKVEAGGSERGDLLTSATPYGEIKLHGEGGVDAGIAWAMVNADVVIIAIEYPSKAEVKVESGEPKAITNSEIKVSGLGGKIYFKAGICLPVPFFDDICKDFQIDILNWDGLEKTLKVDPNKGIIMK